MKLSHKTPEPLGARPGNRVTACWDPWLRQGHEGPCLEGAESGQTLHFFRIGKEPRAVPVPGVLFLLCS